MKRTWLAPLVPLYRVGLAWRELRLQRGVEPARRLQWPVISIGNLSTGGSGKTPFAITLAKLLISRGVHVDVLSRGYGRASRLPAKVDLTGSAGQFGDEPLLIARAAGVPVYVAPQRYDAGLLAEAEAGREAPRQHESRAGQVASVHILDDGFQHRQLHRDVNILLLNREDWHDTLLPAGNLREALRAAMRADVLAIPADDADFERELAVWGWRGPVWRLRRRMQVPSVEGPVFAFCGIARPEQFFNGLTNAGLKVAARKSFRDHYDYTGRDIETLVAKARASRAVGVLTTAKDAVRLEALASSFPVDLPLKIVGMSVEIEDEVAAVDWLAARLASTSAPSSL
jgi:tetraacyldisaccharide 4'-kinase